MPLARLITTISLCLFFLTGCSPVSSFTAPENHQGEYVVLLHGLARTSHSMKKIQQALIDQGYGTCNISYPSTKHPIHALTVNHVLPQIEQCIPNENTKLHFVSHSLGGIIVRDLITLKKIKNIGNVVMLSPPNKGSETVDKLADFWLFEFINGPAGRELGTGEDSVPNRLGPATFPLGIITGNATINPILSLLIPGDDDGKVSIERARLEGMADFLVVPVSHPFIMKNQKVIDQTLYFLQNEVFRHNTTAGKNKKP